MKTEDDVRMTTSGGAVAIGVLVVITAWPLEEAFTRRHQIQQHSRRVVCANLLLMVIVLAILAVMVTHIALLSYKLPSSVLSKRKNNFLFFFISYQITLIALYLLSQS